MLVTPNVHPAATIAADEPQPITAHKTHSAGRLRQFAIPGVGRIDLLTVDLDTNELVVIELKRDRPERKIVGQITEYMGWVRENLAAPEQKVQGIICVWETTENLRRAVSGIPNLEVFQYELSFEKIGP